MRGSRVGDEVREAEVLAWCMSHERDLEFFCEKKGRLERVLNKG